MSGAHSNKAAPRVTAVAKSRALGEKTQTLSLALISRRNPYNPSLDCWSGREPILRQAVALPFLLCCYSKLNSVSAAFHLAWPRDLDANGKMEITFLIFKGRVLRNSKWNVLFFFVVIKKRLPSFKPDNLTNSVTFFPGLKTEIRE